MLGVAFKSKELPTCELDMAATEEKAAVDDRQAPEEYAKPPFLADVAPMTNETRLGLP